MFSPIQLKRAVKGGAGLAAVAASAFRRRSTATTGCILAYHRVADLGFIDPRHDDWNVPPAMFERQLLALMDCADIVPLAELRSRCQHPTEEGRPSVALTFDDGYANFHSRVLPLLRRYQVPATVFIITSLIGSEGPPPFDAWSVKHGQTLNPEAWRPMNWVELKECAASGLVTIGGHSHQHLKAINLSPHELAQEARLSRQILMSELGDVRCYAYPYGSSRLGYVPDSYVQAVAEAGYDLAVTYDLGMVTGETDPLRMPRIEAHGVDNEAIIRAKTLGSLAPYRLTDCLRQAQRSA
jgi:peptidoglycan/xylan/chitin deacetylase (PgdA/CDA1 family)